MAVRNSENKKIGLRAVESTFFSSLELNFVFGQEYFFCWFGIKSEMSSLSKIMNLDYDRYIDIPVPIFRCRFFILDFSLSIFCCRLCVIYINISKQLQRFPKVASIPLDFAT